MQVAAGGVAAFRIGGIDRVEHDAKPPGKFFSLGDREGDAGLPDLLLGAHLGHAAAGERQCSRR